MTYDAAFFAEETRTALVAARAIMPWVLIRTEAKSAIDVGCGSGAWLSVAKMLGCDVHGVDGNVPDDQLLIDPKEFERADLTEGVDCAGYDLAVCLEVGEHLPIQSAAKLVRGLCRAKFVFWSAAVPGQRGVNHCFPGDTLVGGPSANTSFRRWYEGPIVKFAFSSGHFLTVTPNHPILTPHGWVAAGLLQHGDNVFRHAGDHGAVGVVPDQEHVPSKIEDVATSVGIANEMFTRTVPVTSQDFHGDGVGGKVAVIRSNGLLENGGDSRISQPLLKNQIPRASVGAPFLTGSSAPLSPFLGPRNTPGAANQGCDNIGNTLGTSAGWDNPRHLGTTPNRNTQPFQPASHGGATDAKPASQFLWRNSVPVELDEVVNIQINEFSHWVYNLSTTPSWYTANGIIVHNCNEQWPTWWERFFLNAGYYGSCDVRDVFWDDTNIAPFYRQNIMVYAKPVDLLHAGMVPGVRDEVHPDNPHISPP